MFPRETVRQGLGLHTLYSCQSYTGRGKELSWLGGQQINIQTCHKFLDISWLAMNYMYMYHLVKKKFL